MSETLPECIPWYNMIGNHDINFAAETDELSDATYERRFVPTIFRGENSPNQWCAHICGKRL